MAWFVLLLAKATQTGVSNGKTREPWDCIVIGIPENGTSPTMLEDIRIVYTCLGRTNNGSMAIVMIIGTYFANYHRTKFSRLHNVAMRL